MKHVQRRHGHAICRAHGPANEPEDLVHETFLALLKAVPLAQPDRVLGWLKTTARNKAIDAGRAHRNSRTTPVARIAERPIDDPTAAIHDQLVVDELIASVAEPDGTVLSAYYLHDQPISQIATALRCTTGAIKVRIHRARGRVRTAATERGLANLIPLPLLRLARGISRHATILEPALTLILPAVIIGAALTQPPASSATEAAAPHSGPTARGVQAQALDAVHLRPDGNLAPHRATAPVADSTPTRDPDLHSEVEPDSRHAALSPLPADLPKGTISNQPDTPPDHELGIAASPLGTEAGVGITIHDEPALEPVATTACPILTTTPVTYCHTP